MEAMKWIGIAYTVLSGTALVMAGLARAFPNVPFFTAAAGAVGSLAADFHKFLPGGEQ